MTQSASFYSIPASDFKTISESTDQEFDIAPFVKHYCTLDDSYMALEFTLSQGLDEASLNILEEIFNPTASFGGSDFGDIDIDTIDPEKLEAMISDDASVYYLSPVKVKEANNLLHNISEADIAAKYNAAELNENDIAPARWKADADVDSLYNAAHLLQTFTTLKAFFAAASTEEIYILTYLQG